MNTAIIVAAGSGSRFGADRPKQFHEICGKPVLIHTLEKFESCAAIDEIVLILAASEIADFRQTLEKFPFKKITGIIGGGHTRAASVKNGVDALDANRTQIVAVHDGARPLVTAAEIALTVEKAREKGAVCLTAPLFDTIKTISGDVITGTINRENLRRALTPQTFRCEILKNAFAPGNYDETATDECFLVEKSGREIYYADGGARNIKITTRDDAALLKFYLENEAG